MVDRGGEGSKVLVSARPDRPRRAVERGEPDTERTRSRAIPCGSTTSWRACATGLTDSPVLEESSWRLRSAP